LAIFQIFNFNHYKATRWYYERNKMLIADAQ